MITDLLTDAVDVPKDRQDRTAQIKAGKALRAIGWTRVVRGSDDIRRYFPAESSVERPLKLVTSSSDPPIKKGSRRGITDRGNTRKGTGE